MVGGRFHLYMLLLSAALLAAGPSSIVSSTYAQSTNAGGNGGGNGNGGNTGGGTVTTPSTSTVTQNFFSQNTIQYQAGNERLDGGGSVTLQNLKDCHQRGSCVATLANTIFPYPVRCSGSGTASCAGCWVYRGGTLARVGDLSATGTCPTGQFTVFTGYKMVCPNGRATCTTGGRLVLGCSIRKTGKLDANDSLNFFSRDCSNGNPIVVDAAGATVSATSDCSAGYFRNNQGACEKCARGWYKDSSGDDECTQCAHTVANAANGSWAYDTFGYDATGAQIASQTGATSEAQCYSRNLTCASGFTLSPAGSFPRTCVTGSGPQSGCPGLSVSITTVNQPTSTTATDGELKVNFGSPSNAGGPYTLEFRKGTAVISTTATTGTANGERTFTSLGVGLYTARVTSNLNPSCSTDSSRDLTHATTSTPPCAAGKSSTTNADGSVTCTDCSSGFYKEDAGNFACKQCDLYPALENGTITARSTNPTLAATSIDSCRFKYTCTAPYVAKSDTSMNAAPATGVACVNQTSCALAMDGTSTRPTSALASDGTITATVTGATNALTFSISPTASGNQNGNSISYGSLAANSYTVTAREAVTGCQATKTFDLNVTPTCPFIMTRYDGTIIDSFANLPTSGISMFLAEKDIPGSVRSGTGMPGASPGQTYNNGYTNYTVTYPKTSVTCGSGSNPIWTYPTYSTATSPPCQQSLGTYCTVQCWQPNSYTFSFPDMSTTTVTIPEAVFLTSGMGQNAMYLWAKMPAGSPGCADHGSSCTLANGSGTGKVVHLKSAVYMPDINNPGNTSPTCQWVGSAYTPLASNYYTRYICDCMKP